MISVTSSGDFDNIRKWATKMRQQEFLAELSSHGKAGVDALAASTPVDSKLTASSWRYRIVQKPPGIEWYNTNTTTDGTPVAILIQYGHGTGTGGYIQGRDYINPSMRPIFDKIADEIWKKVKA